MAITSQQLDRQKRRDRKNAPGQGRKPKPGYKATIRVRFESEEEYRRVLKHLPDLLMRGNALVYFASDMETFGRLQGT